MAQLVQEPDAPEPALGIAQPEDAESIERAVLLEFPETNHPNDVVRSLEQQAFSTGADFVGK